MVDPAVCFDAMGVLYTSPDDVGELLIPFARIRGSVRSESDIRAMYRRCSLGELTSADLWRWLGVPGEAAALDAAYTSGHRKNDDVARLAASLAAQGATVACLSNDIREWSQLLRRRHGLDRDIGTWIVSGDVGIRKPDDGIYQALLDTTRIAPASWTFIDDREANLDTAARLGFRTIRFGAPSAAHASARGGTDLAALIPGGAR